MLFFAFLVLSTLTLAPLLEWWKSLSKRSSEKFHAFLENLRFVQAGSGADPGFFLGGGAALRNDVTEQ